MGNITLLMSSENLYIEDEPGHYAYHFEQFVKKYAVILIAGLACKVKFSVHNINSTPDSSDDLFYEIKPSPFAISKFRCQLSYSHKTYALLQEFRAFHMRFPSLSFPYNELGSAQSTP